MRNFCAAIMATALLTVTAAQAASDTSSQPAPLAPGKAAGLRPAQDDNNDALFYIIGAGVIAAGVAILVSDNDNGNGSSSPASSPSTK